MPHMKPMGFVTDMEAAVIILEGYQCRGKRLLHQPLEGSNALGRRTAQAGRWPDKLDDVIAEIIQLQMTIDDQRAEPTVYATRSREQAELDAEPRRSARLRRRVGILPSLPETPQQE